MDRSKRKKIGKLWDRIRFFYVESIIIVLTKKNDGVLEIRQYWQSKTVDLENKFYKNLKLVKHVET